MTVPDQLIPATLIVPDWETLFYAEGKKCQVLEDQLQKARHAQAKLAESLQLVLDTQLCTYEQADAYSKARSRAASELLFYRPDKTTAQE